MSNSYSESYTDRQEGYEGYYMPRKFVFDTQEEDSKPKKEQSKEVKAIKKSLQAERQMPYVFNFPEPANYKESYSQLVKHILSAYNHVRLLVVEEYFDVLKNVTRDFRIERPSDCVTIIKEILNGCCERLQTLGKDGKGENQNYSVNDYEELLQKAEAKIRIFIRNEQIFRLNFDVLTQKCEDSEKIIEELQHNAENLKKAQETIRKENLTLMSKLKHKDDEVRKLNKELDVLQKNLRDVTNNLSTLSNADSSSIVYDSKKNTNQLLNMLMNENKTMPVDALTRMTPVIDSKTVFSRLKQGTKYPPTEKSKERSSVTPGNTSFVNTSSSNLKKDPSDKLKKIVMMDYKRKLISNREALNASLDKVLNKTTDQSQERTYTVESIRSQKRSSQGMNLDYSQEQMYAKPPSRERKQEKPDKAVPLHVINKNVAIQKVLATNKYSNASTRPTSTGKARESPLVYRSRVVHTEHSTDHERSQDSRILYTYATTFGNEALETSYTGVPKKKKSVSRNRDGSEEKNSSKGTDKSRVMIQNMITEQLNRKLNGKQTI